MPIHKTKNEDFFKIWTPEMAYVLGFFAADGSMIRNKRGGCYIEFQITDGDLLEKFEYFFDPITRLQFVNARQIANQSIGCKWEAG